MPQATPGGPVRSSDELMARAVSSSSVYISVVQLDGTIVEINESFLAALGLDRDAAIGRTTIDLGLWADPSDRGELLRRAEAEGSVRGYEVRLRDSSGEMLDLLLNADLVEIAGQRYLLTMAQDVTTRTRGDVLRLIERRLLEKIASNASLPEVLDALCRDLESFAPGMLASVLLLDADGPWLRHAASPSLPPAYVKAIDGMPIGPNAGSCGTAAFLGTRVVVPDIATDPLWDAYRHLAMPHGLRACWSTPIRSSAGTVLGTFAVYYREPRSPSDQDLTVVELATKIAGIAAERMRDKDRSHHRSRHEVALAYLAQRSPALDLDALLEEATALVARTLEADLCAVFEPTPEGLQIRAATGEGAMAGSVAADPGPEVLEAIEGTPTLVPEQPAGPATPLLLEARMESGLTVPITTARGPFGALGTYWRRARRVGSDEERFVVAVGGLLGLAVPLPVAAPAVDPAHEIDPLVIQRLARLTPGERRALELVGEGLSNRQIADRLGLAEKTVRNRVSALLGKLGLQRRTQAALLAIRLGAQ